MTLQEMLDHTAGFYLDDRAALISGTDDKLFSDATLVRFLNEGADRFARKTWRLQSSYSAGKAWTFVTLATGVKDYALNSRILRVLSAKLSDTDLDLLQVGYDDIRPTASHLGDPDFFDINSPYTDTPGRPQWYATDIDLRTIRFRSTPTLVENGLVVQMRVVYMPIVQLAVATPGGVCEIEPEYHELICQYAAGKALLAPNTDSTNQRVGAGFVKDFDDQCRQLRIERFAMQSAPAQFRFGGWVRDTACR